MNPVFTTLFNQFTRFRPQLCVAGGAVADYDRAGDIDLFVFDTLDKSGVHGDVLDQVIDHLDATMVEYPDPASDGYTHDRQRYAVVRSLLCSRPIDVIATSHNTPESLIDSFDISIHARAAVPGRGILLSPLATGRYATPRVLRWTTPKATKERLIKLCRRYTLPIPTDDYTRLTALIVKGTYGQS